jgi:hypothetical protein
MLIHSQSLDKQELIKNWLLIWNEQFDLIKNLIKLILSDCKDQSIKTEHLRIASTVRLGMWGISRKLFNQPQNGLVMPES